MHSARLAARRSSAQSGLLATVCAVALVVTALVVGLLGYLDLAATASTRAFLAGAAPTASAVQVEVKLADDPTAQTRAAETFFGREFSGLPVEITRTLLDYPLPATVDGASLTVPGGGEARVTVVSDEGFADHAAVVDGTLALGGGAATGVPGVLQADAAELLGLAVGDELTFGTAERHTVVTVVGTWRADDADDPRWFGAPGVAGGTAGLAGDGTPSFGPLVVDEATLSSIGPVPFVHWTIVPDAAQVTPSELDRLGGIAAGLRDDILEDQSIGRGSILVTGTLAATASTVQNSLNSVRGVTPVGILLVALIGLIALVQLARLLSLARRPENALLRSRGASAQWLTATGLVEAAVVAALGCSLGFAAAGGALVAVFGESALAFAPGEYAVLIGVAVVVIFGATAFLDAIRIARRDSVDDSGRTRAAATIGTAVLTLAAAAVAVWQSLLYGSPLVTTASGRTAVDPLAVIAPTLALVAIALVLLVAFGPLTAAWQRFAARRPRLQPAYSARQVARGIGGYAVAVLVIALSVGGLTVASAYSGSWQSLSTRTGELTAGADVRIDLGEDLPLADADAVDGESLRGIPGVLDAVPAFSTPLTIGDDGQARLTALPAAAFDGIVTSAGGSLDAGAITQALGTTETGTAETGTAQLRGIELPAGTTRLSLTAALTVTAPGGEPISTSGYVQTALWFLSERGAILTVTLPRVEADGSRPVEQTLSAELPESGSPWRLVAIDYSVKADAGWWETTYGALTASAGAEDEPVPLDTRSWGRPFAAFAYGQSLLTGEDTLTMGSEALEGFPTFYRVMDVDASPGAGLGFFPPDPVPLLVTGSLADRYGVAAGDAFDLRFSGTGLSLSGTVVGVVPLVPGIQSPAAVFADLTGLEDFLLRSGDVVPRANELWLDVDPAGFDAAALEAALPEGARVTTPATATDQSFASPAELALWIAAAGSLLLAAISLGAVALTLARSRRGEVVVLRAVGLSARRQSRSRLGELLAIIGLAGLFGLAAGLAVAALTVTNLAKSAVIAVPEGLPTRLEFALGTGLVLLGVAGLAMIAIGAAYSRTVRRQALDTEERLETR